MRIAFTKMQGAGNDFVVLDQTRRRLNLSRAQLRWLADRHFGVGADQILSVLPSPTPGVDFAYQIHNADGGEVEHCGNGARCFMAYVRSQGLSSKDVVRVQTVNRLLELEWLGGSASTTGASGSVVHAQVRVDMEAPRFALSDIPFDAAAPMPVAPQPRPHGGWPVWQFARPSSPEFATLMVAAHGYPTLSKHQTYSQNQPVLEAALVSMGNPHAVVLVSDVDATDVAFWGPWLQSQAAFVQGVNVGFLQVQGRSQARLRVYERGAGETLACGTGACAAAVAGMRLGLLDAAVQVQTRGGPLTLEWAGGAASVFMTGPATRVFDAEIDLPDLPERPH
jgi:diaminopimelate epimerase